MASPKSNQGFGGFSQEEIDRMIKKWKPADIGFFDPLIKDPGGFTLVNGIVHYTSVYTFVERIHHLASLKPEKAVRAQLHSCLKNDALSWYTGLLDIEKRLLTLETLQNGWFKSLIDKFKPHRCETLSELEYAFYGWPQIRAGKTAHEHAYNIIRLLKASGTYSEADQVQRIIDSLDGGLRRDLLPADKSISAFIEKLDFYERIWRRQSTEHTSGSLQSFVQDV
ncbi:hypothetical protein N7466_010149 [Penicillium verhagenii]|uniref:uncharacterized protein n=1 Tax=Penicillium verhagenii TaxID=1562060 RepID=UPI002544DBC4|nr:uncharacterized protein N7466_010149 [Penicillium verhagenii]KAJ5919206.1 hypothetical protein N7466_010149 [Penicillium verhagenii]